MAEVVFGARMILAAVFAVAGTAKLLDRGQEFVSGFGVSPRLVAPLRWILIVAELAVAGALLWRVGAWWGGAAALCLLFVFSVAIVRSLVRGQRPDCRCFGQLRAAPIGVSTLIRNGALAALAAFVVAAGWNDPGPSAVGPILALASDGPSSVIGLLGVVLLAVVIGMLARVLANLSKLAGRLADIEARLDEAAEAPTERPDAATPDRGLPIGAPAPSFALADLDGRPRSLAGLLEDRRPVLLLFVAPDCMPCAALLPSIAGWLSQHGRTLTIRLVSTGTAEANRAKFGGTTAVTLLLQTANEVADAYGAQWTPAAILIGVNGRVASAVSYGDTAIGALVDHAAAMPNVPFLPSTGPRSQGGSLRVVPSGPARLGDPAPAIGLADLDGHPVDLHDYRGRETVVVFWDDGCPHCQRLAEDLRRWEAEPPRDAPRLLVVSSGSAEATRAFGFRSTVALDREFRVAGAFGVSGTPSAVLVDADGRIASTIGSGARDVMALLCAAPRRALPGTGPVDA